MTTFNKKLTFIICLVLSLMMIFVFSSCQEGNEPSLNEDTQGGGQTDDPTPPAHVHTEEIIPGKEPSCLEEGLSDGIKCSDCGEILLEQEVLGRSSHKQKIIKGYEATCEKSGLTDGVECATCGVVLLPQREISQKSHTQISISGYESTCFETGRTDGKKCFDCGKILFGYEEIPTKPHDVDSTLTCKKCGWDKANVLVLTVDISSSMREVFDDYDYEKSRFGMLLEQLEGFISNLDENTYLGIVAFDRDAHPILSIQRVGTDEKAELISNVLYTLKHSFYYYYLNEDGTESEITIKMTDTVADYVAQGYNLPQGYKERNIYDRVTKEYIKTYGTGYYNALSATSDMLDAVKALNKKVIFLTDGETSDPTEDYENIASKMAQNGVMVCTLGIDLSSSSYAIPCIKRIASLGGGAVMIENDSEGIAEALRALNRLQGPLVLEAPNYEPSEGLEYTYLGNAWAVSGIGSCTDTEIKLPRTIGGEPLVAVLEEAFYLDHEIITGITSITIPDTVETFGNRAFFYCESLENVYYQGTIEQWCNITFGDTHSNPMGWGKYLYINGEVMTDIVIPEGVTVIKANAFDACEFVNSITIPNSVVKIEQKAFYGCSSLRSIIIPSSVEEIANNVFSACTGLYEIYNLTSLNIVRPNSNTVIHTSLDEESILTTTSDGFEFAVISEETIILLGYKGNKTELILPNDYNGKSYSINEKTFAGVSVESIVIPGGIKIIPQYAFKNCTSLKSVVLENGVTGIDAYAFSGCTSLESIIIPNSVTTVGNYAFNDCTSLAYNEYEGAYYLGSENNLYLVLVKAIDTSVSSITIHNDTKIIANSVFMGCTSLESITIPNGVTSIGDYAFSGCTSLEGILIPLSVTSIGSYAFEGCTSLTGITIPDGVTSIGSYAFSDCTSLVEINFNAKNMTDLSWNNYAFKNAGQSGNGIKVTIGKDVTKIPSYLFYPYSSSSYSPKITSVIFEEGSVCSSIGYYAFSYCSSLQSITIPNGVTNIGYSAFEGCTSLTIYCEAEAKPSGWHHRWNCSNCPVIWGCVSTFTDNGIVYGVDKLGNAMIISYEKIDSEILAIPSSVNGYNVVSINQNAFKDCTTLKNVILTSNITKIGGYAFSGCINLVSIMIPLSVATIENNAFEGCTSLTISCEAEAKPSGWGSNWSSGCTVAWGGTGEIIVENSIVYSVNTDGNLTVISCDKAVSGVVVIPSVIDGKAVVSISDSAFKNSNLITSITIPSSVTSIGNSAFGDCTSLAEINFNAINMTDLSSNNYVFKNAGQNGNGIKVTIGKEVTKIPSYLFYPYSNSSYSPKITSVVFEEGSVCSSIGNYAFYGCTSLTSITIPNGVTSIGNYAFYDCTSLESILIPLSVTSMGYYVFNYCTSLTICCEAETMPSGWGYDWQGECPVYWGTKAFGITDDGVLWAQDTNDEIIILKYQGSKAEIVIPSEINSLPVTSIKSSAFEGCTSLESITIGDGVTSIGSSAFRGCTSLTSITIGADVTSIGSSAFERCTSLESILIPLSVATIENDAFYNCTSLTICCEASSEPSGWSSYWNFSDCPVVWGCLDVITNNGLVYVVYNDKTASVLSYTEELGKDVVILSTVNGYDVVSVASRLFTNNKKIESVTIPNSLTSIGSSAFNGCTSLTSITIGADVTSIGSSAFERCTSLVEINFNAKNMADLSSNNYVFGNAGQNGDGIKVTIGKEVTRIPSYLFCPSFDGTSSPRITSVTIGENASSIGSSAFRGCTSLTSITIGDGVTSIGSYAFSGCTSLTSIMIPSSVTSIGNSAFYECTTLTIYCGASSKPSGWDTGWNPSNYPVVWGCLDVITNNGLVYVVYNDKTASVLSYTEELGKDVVILSTVNGYDVVSVASRLFKNNKKIESVTIPNSLTSIGEYTFYGCTSLTSITIGADVTSIGSSAFEGCTSLESITIGAGVTSIGSSAFKGCTSLQSINLPSSIASIGSSAFYGCTSLDFVIIPKSVTSIGANAFSSTKALICCEASTESSSWIKGWQGEGQFILGVTDCFRTDDDFVFAQLENELYLGKYFGEEASITIPTVVNEMIVSHIFSYAFASCTNLTNVLVPDSVMKIGDYAFKDCPNLESINIPESIMEIGTYAFSGCTSLDTIILTEIVETIGDSAFSGCTRLVICCKIASKPSGWSDTWSDTATVIWDCDEFGTTEDGLCWATTYEKPNEAIIIGYNGTSTKVVIPSNVNGINVTSIAKNAFHSRADLEGITIGENVTSIEGSAFSGCTSLVEINFNAKNMADLSSNNYVFKNAGQNGDGIKVTIGKEVTRIPSYLFCPSSDSASSPRITSVTIGENASIIGNSAFEDCTSLTSITIPNGVTSIEDSAFSGCTSLVEINFNAKNMSDLYSYNCVFENAGQNGNGIKVTIGKEVTKIPSYLFYPYYSSSYSPKITSVVFEEGSVCSSIGCSVFYHCSSLQSINLPSSVTSIESYAFRGCTSLESITIPAGVTSMGDYVFNDCTSLTICCEAETMPSGWDYDWHGECPVYWGTKAFGITDDGALWAQDTNDEIIILKYQGSKAEIVIPSEINSLPVTSIGYSAFNGCTSLTSITIPASVTSIKSSAFSGCTSLTSITIGASVTSIGNSAFSGCTSLQSITISNSVTSIGNSAFSGCTSLQSITIPNSVTNIGYSAFSGCTSLTSITIPSSVTSIENSAFYDCTSLESILIPLSVTSIGRYAFEGCTSLTGITIPDGVTSIGSYAFSECTSLAEINFNAINMTDLSSNNYVFENAGQNGNGIKVTIGKDVTKIPSYLFYPYFYASPKITSVTFEEGSVCSSIGNYAFSRCSSLQSITIPDGVTSIGDYAFSGCTSLVEITIPSSVQAIGSYAFDTHGNSLIIYCQAISKPSGWDNSWHTEKATIFWNIKEYGTTSDGFVWARTNDKPNEVTISRYTGKATDVIVPSKINGISVAKIVYGAFNGCNLTSITLPFVGEAITSNTHLGYIFGALTYQENATYVPSSLKSVVISGSTLVAENAFYGCTYIESLEIPSLSGTLASIFDSSTANVPTSLKALVVGGDSIAQEAFKNCTSLESVTIRDSVSSIGLGAFEGCTSLKSLTIPFVGSENGASKNTHFGYIFGAPAYGDNPTYVPSSLTSVTVTGSEIASQAFRGITSLVNVTLKNGVTSIGSYAFGGCTSLEKVIIPLSTEAIGSYAFRECASLTIYCEAESKQAGWGSTWSYGSSEVVWGYTEE